MRYKIQDANKTFKNERRALCLSFAKNFFQNDALHLHSFFESGPLVCRRKFPSLLGLDPGLCLAVLDLHLNHIAVFFRSFHFVKRFGHFFVKIHFKEKNHFDGLLHFEPFAFRHKHNRGENDFGFGGRNRVTAKNCGKPKT